VRSRVKDGLTPLHFAAAGVYLRLAEVLLRRGTSLQATGAPEPIGPAHGE
jgi:ankyrin repeat protein